MSPSESSRSGSPEPWRVAVAEFQREVRALYGPRLVRVILYGSRARGDAEEGSDIDLMVVLKDAVNVWSELDRMNPISSRLSLEHNVVITTIPIEEREYQERRSPLLLNVRREGVPVDAL
ncbi:MAG: nucleotidyltransferase domain-containing protein [Halobacteria archaeon]